MTRMQSLLRGFDGFFGAAEQMLLPSLWGPGGRGSAQDSLVFPNPEKCPCLTGRGISQRIVGPQKKTVIS